MIVAFVVVASVAPTKHNRTHHRHSNNTHPWAETETETQKDIIYAHVNEIVFCVWCRVLALCTIRNSHSLTLHLFSWNHIQNHLIYDRMHCAFDQCLNAVVSLPLLPSLLLSSSSSPRLFYCFAVVAPSTRFPVFQIASFWCCNSSSRKITVHIKAHFLRIFFPCFA